MAIDRTLVVIRERSAIDLLDLALVVVRRRPGTLGLAALAGIAPFAALNNWLFWSVPDLPPILPQTLWMLEAPFATAPLTLVLGGLMFGKRPSLRSVLASLGRSAFPLLAVHGLLRFVLFFWLTTRLAFANEILLLERGKWWKILARGGDLARGRGSELFLLGAFQVIATWIFAVAFSVAASRAWQSMLAEELTWDAPDGFAFAGWMFQVPIWLMTAFFAVARFLFYIDQRIRLEGWEVELRLRAVAETMREARRW